MRSFFGAPVSSGPPKKWTIGDNLGEGSYGRVNLALNGETGELFALKEVKIAVSNGGGGGDKGFIETHHHHHHHPYQHQSNRDGKRSARSSLDGGGSITPTVQDPRLRESIVQLEQEVHMLSQLTHPNIVRYIGIKRRKDILNVFMEYVPGGSIASLLQRFGPLGDNVTRVYTRQILIGLDYLHSQRVVHRDIKGANILVEKSGRIKLADFGMAKMLEFVDVERNSYAKKAVKGSAYWMAPEVIRKSEVTLGCDVWSVGCTVIEMASAKPPWCECSTQVQAMFKIASSTALPTLPEKNLSADAKAFILNCLKRNVEERPDVETLLMDPFVDDSLNEKMCRAPALKYEQHDGSYSNFPDNQSLVSSQVSLDDPSEETDVADDDDDDADDDDSNYGGDDTDLDESSLQIGGNVTTAFQLSQSPSNNEGLIDPSVLGARRNIALKPLVVNSTRSRNEKTGSRTGSSSAAQTSKNNSNTSQ
jgi:mitogen-activated protein kinase kinase kinase